MRAQRRTPHNTYRRHDKNVDERALGFEYAQGHRFTVRSKFGRKAVDCVLRLSDPDELIEYLTGHESAAVTKGYIDGYKCKK